MLFYVTVDSMLKKLMLMHYENANLIKKLFKSCACAGVVPVGMKNKVYLGLQGKRGFTLIELMITIGVLAIIATTAIPSFSNLVAKQRLDASARAIAQVFGDARAQAATLRRVVTVTPTIGTNTEVVFHWSPKYEDIELINGTQSVLFNENGLARRINLVAGVETEIPLNFQLCSTSLKQSKTVVLSRTGVVEAIRDSGAC